MNNRAARGILEVENNKGPCTSSKFHFSKGKYGNIVLAWHSVLIRKAKANFQDICAEAQKIYGVTDDGNQLAQVDPEIRTCVGLDSESEGASDNDSAGNEGHENHQNGDGDYHSGVGDNDEIDASDGNTNNNQNEGNGHHASDVVHNPEYQLEEVSNHAGPSRLGGRRSSIRASGSQSTVHK